LTKGAYNSIIESTFLPERESVRGIRFAVSADDAPDRVAFAYSPLQEAVLSLHVLVAPKHHALQHRWVRSMRKLPAALKRRIAEFGFAYRWTMPDFITASPEGEFSDFEHDLRVLAHHDAETLGLDFLRPLYDHAGKRDAALLGDTEVRRHAFAQVDRHGASRELVTLIFDDPAELGRRFAALVTDYWEAAFADEWARLEPQLTEAVSQAGREIAVGGFYAFVGSLSPRLRVEPELEQFGLDLPHHHRVEVTEERKLVLVPSAFVWPHVRVNCDEPWPLTLVYPARFVIDEARPHIPSADLVSVLDALGNATRLHTLKLTAARPRSTQELAKLVGLTEAGMSKHLHKLAAAGLVNTRREGYYVLYSADVERLRPLSGALLDYLGDEVTAGTAQRERASRPSSGSGRSPQSRAPR
jgi:DNA-binding transcriptional ArsR family regulator